MGRRGWSGVAAICGIRKGKGRKEKRKEKCGLCEEIKEKGKRRLKN